MMIAAGDDDKRGAMFRRRILVAGLLALALGRAAAADEFVRAISDLPLMPGLADRTGDAVVFDKPTGRIVEATAAGPVDPDAVVGFYGGTLPQLGWQPAVLDPRRATFLREDEMLSITVDAGPGGGAVVQFSLSPR